MCVAPDCEGSEGMTDYELKPCPYCNSDDNIKIYHRKTMFGGEKWMICCAGYGCFDSEYVFAKSREKAIEKWNKRSDRKSGTLWQEVEV